MSTVTTHRAVNDFKAKTPPGLPRQPGWIVWPLWVAASIVGFALGATAFRGTGTIGENTPFFIALPVSVVSFLFLATLPGLLHWLILRGMFARAGWWILASGVGSLLGFLILSVGIAGADTGEGFLFISD